MSIRFPTGLATLPGVGKPAEQQLVLIEVYPLNTETAGRFRNGPRRQPFARDFSLFLDTRIDKYALAR